MAAKEIIYNESARSMILAGVNALANASAAVAASHSPLQTHYGSRARRAKQEF